jgi:hypothetical protein
MMVPGYFGLQFVGWMGVAMVLFGISGLVLLMWWTGAPGDRQKVDGGSPSR